MPESWEDRIKRLEGTNQKPQQPEQSFWDKAYNFMGQMNYEYLKRQQEAGQRILQALEEPGRLMNQGVSQLGENPLAGVVNIGNSLMSLVASPFAIADAVTREVPGGNNVADIVAYPFEQVSIGISKGEELIQEGLEQIPGYSKEAERLYWQTQGLNPKAQGEITEALHTANMMGGQFLVGGLMGKLGSGLKGKEGFKPVDVSDTRLKELKNEKFPEITPEIKPEQKLLPASPINLREIPKEEQIAKSQAKLQLDELVNKKEELKNKYQEANKNQKKSILKEINKVNEDIKVVGDLIGQKLDVTKQTSELPSLTELKDFESNYESLGIKRNKNGTYKLPDKKGNYSETNAIKEYQSLKEKQGIKEDIIDKPIEEIKTEDVKTSESIIKEPTEQEIQNADLNKLPARDYQNLRELFSEEKSQRIAEFVENNLSKDEFKKLTEEADKDFLENGNNPEARLFAEAQKIVEARENSTKTNKEIQPIEDQAIESQKPEYGSQNKLFTKEKLEQAKKNIVEKGQRLSAGIDPTIYKDYLDVAGYHFEAGARKFADFSQSLIKEFGEQIKPHLLKLWADVQKQKKNIENISIKTFEKINKSEMSSKDKFTTSIEESKFAKELQSFLDDPNIPKDVQGKILSAIGGREIEFSGRQLGDFRRKALDRGSNLTKKYGAPGAEIYQLGLEGGGKQKALLETAYNKFLNPLREITNESPERFRGEIAPQIIKALEDRQNADTYLKTPEAKKSYELVKGLYDHFRGELDKAGIKTVDDYFTHQLTVDITDRIFNDEIMIDDPKNLKKGSINDYYTANSPFAKERRSEAMGLMNTNLVNVLNNYVHSISRHLAYKDMIEFYKNGFLDEINKSPVLKTKTDLSYMKDHLKGILYPEIITSKASKFVTNRRNNLYQALLWNNWKASLQNLGQKMTTQFFTSKETQDLAKNIYRNQSQITGKLADAIAEIKKDDMSHYLDLTTQEAKRIRGEKFDAFRVSEKGNWKFSELAGILEGVKKSSGKDLVSLENINQLLSDPKVYNGALREARDLSSKTQFNPDVTFRPIAYDKWAIRTFAMFTRFPIGTADLFVKTAMKSLEGVEGLRAQTILRRGLVDAETIKPVEFLRATEYYRKSLEASLKQSKKEGYNFAGVPEKNIRQYIDFLKKKESGLNEVIGKLEPMNKTKNARIWGKYLSYSAAVSFAYRMVQAQLWDAVGITDNKGKTVGQHLTNTLMDVSPLPFYRFNPSEVLSVPLVPNTEFMLYGNWNLKGGTRNLLNYGFNTTPYLNTINQTSQRLTGESAVDLLFKKNKKSKYKGY